ncbi:MAG: uroporphyrinogen decarboxylase family protein [Anaerolineales bacterium]
MQRHINSVWEKYPEERVADSRDALSSAWMRIPGKRVPFIYAGSALGEWDQHEFESMWYHHINNPDDLLEYELRRILSRAELVDDFIPLLSVHGRDGDISVAFPGVYEVLQNDVFWIRSHLPDVKSVYSLTKPDYTKSPPTRRVLECIKYFVKETGGAIPINASSIPGPAVMAGHILGFERLMTAFYDYPDEMHYLIDLCTECIIDMFELEIEAAQGALSPMSNMWFWMPLEAGVFLNEDTIQALSPNIIQTYLKDSYERIARRFGGVVLHSCGYWKSSMKTAASIDGIVGFQAGLNETPLEDQLGAIEGKYSQFVLNIHTSSSSAVGKDGKAFEVPSAKEVVTDILPGLCEKGVFTCALAGRGEMTIEEANQLASSAREIKMRA